MVSGITQNKHFLKLWHCSSRGAECTAILVTRPGMMFNDLTEYKLF
jgi:hypothetical protein